MAYFNQSELEQLGFKHLGKNVKISTKASVYNHDQIEIADNSRIDDFCLLSGKLSIGKFVHITPYCNLAGGERGIIMEDFSTLAYGVHVFTQSDDYSGETMTNSNIPEKYKNVKRATVYIGKHSIVGAGSILMPGVELREGTSIGAMSLVRKSTEEWSIYVGNPAKKIKNRSRELLVLEKEFLKEIGGTTETKFLPET
jgi:acetyltransferase-like isoleucine patch superfamily enzyme